MSNGFREVMEIRARPGRALLFLSSFLIPGSLLSIHGANLSLRWKVVAVLALIAAAALEFRSWSPPESVPRTLRAILQADGRWRVSCGISYPVGARLTRVWGASLGPVLALEWQCDDGIARRAWLIRSDLPERDWRRLRVRLRLA